MRKTAVTMAALLLAASAVTAPPAAAGEIGGCFGDSCYTVIPTSATWPEAEAICEERDQHLVTINSVEENQFVYNLIAPTPEVSDLWWLGGGDEETEGTFEWVTGEPFVYTNWAQDNPDDDGWGLGEDYLAIGGPSAQSGPMQWIDWQYEDDGSASTLPFVCESTYPNPGMGVFVGPDFTTLYVAGWNFTANSIATLQIDHGADGSVEYQDQGILWPDDLGFGYVAFGAAGHFTVADGDRVRLSDDNGLAKEMIAKYVTLDVLDPAADLIAGAARATTDVPVVAGRTERWDTVATVTADASERWYVDLGELGFDLQQGMTGWLELFDVDETGDNSPDYTWLDWAVLGVPARFDDLRTIVTDLEVQPPAASKGLVAKVKSAQRSYELGHVAAACGQLGGLLGQVGDFEAAGKLTAQQAATLHLAAVWTRVELGC